MITKMKKLTFLVYHKEYEEFLQNIRNLGVVHVAEKMQGTAESAELQENIKLSGRYAATLKLLQNLNAELHEQTADIAFGQKILEEVDKVLNEKAHLNQQLQVYAKERDSLEVWGDFDPASVKRLQEAGFQIDFYICTESQFKDEWLEEYNAIEINRIGSKIYFIT